MFGFMGRILVVDLTKGTANVLEKDEPYFKSTLGGSYLASRLFEEIAAGTPVADPFSPENPLIFATGPLAGTNLCGSTRVNVLSFSPETTGIYTSQGGGEFGPDIKRAGFDALIVTGASSVPVYLDIYNDQVLFEDAAALWGQERHLVYQQLYDGTPNKVSIASIGPAGENRARHANIMFEPDHFAGRGGMGAVMGAKHLKAIRIGGDRKVIFQDEQRVKEINKNGATAFLESYGKNPQSFLGVLRTHGTYGLLMLNQNIGNLPVNNYNTSWLDDADFDSAVAHDNIGDTVVGKRTPCKGCYLGCKKKSAASSEHGALAEYESMAMLGPNLGISDMNVAMEFNERCNRLGMDTISTGALISYLMDGFGNNDLDEKKIGFSIRFGETEKAFEVIRMMAHRDGKLGNLLADGIEACRSFFGTGADKHLRFSRGMGLPAHMPRAKPGIGFGYLHGPNPADHMKAEHDWIASSPDDLKAFHVEGTSEAFALDDIKVEVYRATQIYYAAMDSLSLCMFIFGPGNIYTFDDIVALVNAATGFDYSFEDLMQLGEKAIHLQRKLYLETGGSDEGLPPFMEKEIPDGPIQGNRLSSDDFVAAREHYYKIWGWDAEGRPTSDLL